MKNNPYSVLGISPSYSEDEAKSTYRTLVKKYHPDGSHGDIEKFNEIQKAWEQLNSYGEKAFGRKSTRVTHETLFKFRRV